MNKQVAYITQAHLILVALAAGFWIVSKIPSSTDLDHNDSFISTLNSPALLSPQAEKGKTLFMAKCASCHNILQIATGPKLADVLKRGPWSDRKQLYEWIRNPEAFMKNNAYVQALRKEYGIVMMGFSNITDEEIDEIMSYISEKTDLGK